ncbi:MAG: PKD domain-containing protein, partial [Planctomycetes bacterium]|nr:PKD domain-containing protein [Planctomycetota bacterium]
DPNLKIGPSGYGDRGYLTDNAAMPYTILFENLDTATAAAVEVRVTDQLDPSLDCTTLTLGEIGFGEQVLAVPKGLSHFEGRVEFDGWTFNATDGWHRGETPLVVDVEAGIDIDTGELYWSLKCADPETGNFPTDAYAGFLPPDKDEITYPHPDNAEILVYPGEGYLTYSIRPRAGLATGTEIRNAASIVFDTNEPIDTPGTLNTIDSGAPTSSVTALPAETIEPSFPVAWTGQDDVGGSDIARFKIYVSVDGEPFALWKGMPDSSAVYAGEFGHTYAFYSMAVDNVGNHEAPRNTADTSITVRNPNAPPEIGVITAPLDPVQLGTAINVSADFTDPDTWDTHTAVWDWGDGTSSAGTVTETDGSGSVDDCYTYPTVGIYTVTLTVIDAEGETDESVFQYVVVYDPEGGFVTGGGWIDSPEGAFVDDPALTGKANFGFVSKYQRGANVPTGQTQFQFKVADLNFHSTSYQWLVIGGPKAKFKGSGTINGDGDYGFMLTAVDGQRNGGGGVDKFRMKVWDKATDEIVYDNQMDADDGAEPTTAIGGGSIVIHSGD